MAYSDTTIADVRPSKQGRTLLASTPAAVHVLGTDGRLKWVSDRWLQMLGYARADVIERPIRDFMMPESQQGVMDAVRSVMRAEADCEPFSAQMQTQDGRVIDVVFDIVVQPAVSGGEQEALVVTRDVTEQLAGEQRLRDRQSWWEVLDTLNQQTRMVTDPEQVLPVALRVLGRHLGASRCAFAHVDASGKWFTIPHDYTDGCASTAGRYELSLFGTRAVAKLTSGRTLVVRNVDTELSGGDGAESFNAMGIKAIVCCSYIRGGVFRAMMAVHQVEPRDWTAGEISIIQEFVERCWSLIEQRRAELSLRRSEALLRLANRAARMAEWSFETPDGEVSCSEELCAILGLPHSTELSVEQVIGFVSPEHRDVMCDHVRSCVADGTPFDVECVVITTDGQPLWIHAVGLAERGRDGQIERFLGAFQDISERKAGELALIKSHESLRVTLRSIGDAVITTDPTGSVTWMNPVAERLTGWTADDAVGRPLQQVFQVIDEETRLPTEDPVTTCLQRREVVGLASHTVLLSRQGKSYGIEHSAAPILDDASEVLGVVLVFHDASEQRRLSSEMRYRASHDDLTGLLNRSEFDSRLRRLLVRAHDDNSTHALMFMDLDQFKVVNDSCGHSVGDQLLQQVSRLLLDTVRSRDTVARLGGDEFGVLLNDCTIEQAQRVAQKICERLDSNRFVHDDRRFRVGVSIGLVPVHNRWPDAEAVMQAADTSCYAAKDAGRNRVHTWFHTDTEMRARQGEMRWAARIGQALDEDRFVLFGQRIESVTGEQGGVRAEVLLRMLDMNGNLVAPGSFLPAAERYHLASRVDRWVLQKATEWLGSLPDITAVTTLSINLSGQSIGDRAFHRKAGEALAALPSDICKRLCLEITETSAITNFADAARFIDQVHALGVQIALDDFGAGVSSFGYLQNLNVDYLKIDGQFIRSIVDDPLNAAAVRCFVEVAQVVGVKTVAEFVDNPDALRRVTELGVDFAQGFLLHKPEPLDHLVAAVGAVQTER